MKYLTEILMEDQSSPKKGIRKWPFIVLAILLALAATGYYLYDNYFAQNRWKPLLQAELKDLVLKTTDSLYHIEYSDFDLNIASGNATLKNFKLVPDTNVYNKLVGLKKAPDNLFILSVKKLSIKDVGARRAYREKILKISNISIDAPDLTVINKRYAFNDTVKVGKPINPYQMMKKTFKRLHIDSISLKDISVNYINKNSAIIKATALKHLDINIADVVIDSLSGKDPSRFYYTKGITIKIHNYRIKTPDSLYDANLKQIYFSTAERRIILDKVSYLPRYNKKDFYRVVGEATDRFSLRFKRIAIEDIDLQRFLRDQKLYAGRMDVNNAEVEIYNNNAYHGKSTSKIGKDPQQALQKVSLDMRLRRLNIYKSNITYAEADETSGATGIISFNNTSGTILNVTNDPDIKRLDPFMIARIHTHFMDAADLQVNFKFDLTAKDGAFNYSGTLGKFDGKKLDKLVKPLALVHVRSADIQKLTFNVNASNYYGKGQLEFYYNNLNVQLLKKVKGKTELQRQGLISDLANTLIIDDDNPDKKGNFRPGPIDIKRDPTTSFFSFLYKGLLDGLKPSVGYTKKTESTVNKAITKVTTLLDKYKQYKEDRKQKREERKKEKEAKKAAKENEKNSN